MIHLAMQTDVYFGAGTCGKYLSRELRARIEEDGPDHDIDEPLVQFTGPNCEQQTKHKGRPNVGYVFTETSSLTEKQVSNLRKFDILIAGSTWNADVIRGHGLKCDVAIQGVDCDLFKADERTELRNKFVVYSGGKWEHRKGQDLVIRAMKEIQSMHTDIVLMASWHNIWSNDHHYSEANDAGVKIIGLPIVDHQMLSWYMNQTDVGVFPNRCEGGTNLVMMDYMACAKPVIANNGTGQKDVLDDRWSISSNLPDDEMVAFLVNSIEYLYRSRGEGKKLGIRARAAMHDFQWSRTASEIKGAINGWNQKDGNVSRQVQ